MGRTPTRGGSGHHLTEVLVALMIVTGPVLLAVDLARQNMQGSRFNQERATARLVLLDVATLLSGERRDGLRALLAPGGEAALNRRLADRIARMPASARSEYAEQAAPVLGHVRGHLEEDVDPSLPGLWRLTLRAGGPGQDGLEVVQLIRPAARERLTTVPDASCGSVSGP